MSVSSPYATASDTRSLQRLLVGAAEDRPTDAFDVEHVRLARDRQGFAEPPLCWQPCQVRQGARRSPRLIRHRFGPSSPLAEYRSEHDEPTYRGEVAQHGVVGEDELGHDASIISAPDSSASRSSSTSARMRFAYGRNVAPPESYAA